MQRWLLAGLGNPGGEYEKTRHNIGFRVIEDLGRRWGLPGKKEKRFKGILASGVTSSGMPVVLLQPLTFMNLSGESIQAVLNYYDIPPERLLVIYDDTALPFGKLRIRPSGSAGGHNGIKSIIQHLGGDQHFPRLRLGIGPPAHSLHDHVLSRFTAEEERAIAEEILPATAEALEEIFTQGVPAAMNTWNGREILGEGSSR